MNINIKSKYHNFVKLIKINRLEENFDFTYIDIERGQFIESLKKIKNIDLKEIIESQKKFHSGNLSQVEFYSYLKSLKINSLKTYPNLNKYMDYLLTFDSINNSKLFFFILDQDLIWDSLAIASSINSKNS